MKSRYHSYLWIIRILGVFILTVGMTSPVFAAETPAWTITKSHVGDFTQGDQNKVYTITVTNSGSGDTDGSLITVTDTLPAGLIPQTINSSDPAWTCPTGDITGLTVLTCTRTAVMNSGASSVITLTVDVAVDAGDVGTDTTEGGVLFRTVTNSVTVDGGGSPDPDTDNDITRIIQKPDLVITAWELRNAANNAVITNPQPDEEFIIRMTVKNRGGRATGLFYPGVFLDGKPNYGPDHDEPSASPVPLVLGQTTSFSDYRISPAGSLNRPKGCLYYDPSGIIDPTAQIVNPERGNYTRLDFNTALDPGATRNVDVRIAYPVGDYSDTIYDTDNVRVGLKAGSYQIYLYVDPNCSAGEEESYEDNNFLGPIPLKIGTATKFVVGGMWTNAFNYNEGWRVDMHPRLVGDVNGDGKDDLIGIGYAGVFVALANSTGTGFESPRIWSDAFNYNEGWRVNMHPRMVGDVNGDGKDDLIGIGYAGVFVALANIAGNGFNSPTIWTNAFNYNEGWRIDMHPRMVGDVNGDGKDDLIGIGYAGVFVALANSTGTGFESPRIWSDAFNYNEGWRVNMHPRMVGDVNGDGKDDLVGIGNAGVFVALANTAGNGFNSPSLWSTAMTYNEGWRVDMHPRMLADANGDGRDDLIGFGNEGVFVALANTAGNGFNSSSMWTAAFNYNEGWRVNMHPRLVGDINGDGATDLLGFGYAGVFVALAE